MVSSCPRCAGVEAHTIVRDQLTTEHEQHAIRTVRMARVYAVYSKSCPALAYYGQDMMMQLRHWIMPAQTVVAAAVTS